MDSTHIFLLYTFKYIHEIMPPICRYLIYHTDLFSFFSVYAHFEYIMHILNVLYTYKLNCFVSMAVLINLYSGCPSV